MRSWKQESREGDLTQVLAAFKVALTQDYEENFSEAGTAAWMFEFQIDEYIIDFENGPLRGIGVLTRLFSNDRSKGSIFYGRRAFRVGGDQYIYWLG
jgi:hypothetical protein